MRDIEQGVSVSSRFADGFVPGPPAPRTRPETPTMNCVQHRMNEVNQTNRIVPAPGLEPGQTRLQRPVRCQLRYAGVWMQPDARRPRYCTRDITIPAGTPATVWAGSSGVSYSATGASVTQPLGPVAQRGLRDHCDITAGDSFRLHMRQRSSSQPLVAT